MPSQVTKNRNSWGGTNDEDSDLIAFLTGKGLNVVSAIWKTYL